MKPVGRGDGHGGGGIFTDGSRSAPPLRGDVQITGGVHKFQDKLIKGMLNNGYTREFAEVPSASSKASAATAFRKSHAASFALIAYAPQAG